MLDALPADTEKRLRKYVLRYYKDFEQYLSDPMIPMQMSS